MERRAVDGGGAEDGRAAEDGREGSSGWEGGGAEDGSGSKGWGGREMETGKQEGEKDSKREYHTHNKDQWLIMYGDSLEFNDTGDTNQYKDISL